MPLRRQPSLIVKSGLEACQSGRVGTGNLDILRGPDVPGRAAALGGTTLAFARTCGEGLARPCKTC